MARSVTDNHQGLGWLHKDVEVRGRDQKVDWRLVGLCGDWSERGAERYQYRGSLLLVLLPPDDSWYGLARD